MYVHIPFCSRRCDYCAFATWTDRHHLWASYVQACVGELTRASLPPATSVFFGGGTPSLLPPELLVTLLDAVPRAANAEVTVECNPDNVTAAGLGAYRDGGVTRLSFGVQSMDPAVLVSLGREHDPAAVRRAIEAAGAAGFADHYSVDLIYGAVGETLSGWRRTLEAVLAFDPAPHHVSAYALTVEPGTPLANDTSRHPDGDDQADKYLLAEELLGAAGLSWYEISNWARPGAECRHNQLYWAQGAYRGIGCAAHSHGQVSDGSWRRWWNVRTPERYQRLIAEGRSVVAADEVLGVEARGLEGRQLALRTRHGVASSSLDEDPLLDGLVEHTGGRSVLTVRGRLLANEVALRLLPVSNAVAPATSDCAVATAAGSSEDPLQRQHGEGHGEPDAGQVGEDRVDVGVLGLRGEGERGRRGREVAERSDRGGGSGRRGWRGGGGVARPAAPRCGAVGRAGPGDRRGRDRGVRGNPGAGSR